MPVRARSSSTPPAADPSDSPLFSTAEVTPDGTVVLKAPDEAALTRLSLEQSQKKFALLLPVAQVDLTEKEADSVNTYIQARLVLDAAGAAPLRCAGDCPFRAGCPLERIHKAPYNQLCPFESAYVTERFVDWMKQLECTEEQLGASERWAVGQLVAYQVELLRCRAILADPKEASLKSISVRDCHAETGEPISWEEIIAIAAQREDQIVTGMRMLLKDMELTREQQTKRARALGLRRGDDLSTKQSATWEKLRSHQVIDVPTN